MATIVTRAGKGAALTHQEVDANFTGLNTELGQKEVASNKGIANGYASLDAAGKVPSAQLPSYVDDVVEVANFASLPGTGETGKIYVTIDTNKTYRWTGSTYIEISASPGSTDSLAEGSTNLYFTQARARASISASGSLSYNSSTGVMSFSDAVTSVAGRTGAVTLTSSDVGLGNVENKSSATIRGEITSSNVTTALGFTPYNSTNPSGYITSSALSSYLPLSGGTMSGELSAPNLTVGGLGRSSLNAIGGNIGATAGNWNNSQLELKNTDAGTVALSFHRAGHTANTIEVRDGNGLRIDGSFILHAANYGSYALPLIGGTITGELAISTGTVNQLRLIAPGGAQSLWVRAGYDSDGSSAISSPTNVVFWSSGNSGGTFSFVSGNAKVLAVGGAVNSLVALQQGGNQVLHAGNYNSYALPLSGGTLTNGLTGTSGTFTSGLYSRKAQTDGNYTTAALWTESYNNTTTGIAFHISNVVGKFLEMRTNGTLYWNGDTVLHSGNYNSWTPSLTGSGASGTWVINISGSAAQLGGVTASNYFRVDGTYPNTDMNTPIEGYWHVINSASGLPESYYGHRWDYDHLQNGQWIAQFYSPTSGDPGLWFRQRRDFAWQTWRKFLDSSNYGSYALPLSGGTLTGTLTFANSFLRIASDNSGWESGNYFRGASNHFVLGVQSGGTLYLNYGNSAGTCRIEGTTLVNGNTALHAANFSSYALPLSGGTMTGSIVNNQDGAVILESNLSEANNWLWKENAKEWGIFWLNKGSQGAATLGGYSTIGAETLFMGGVAAGPAMPSGWTGYAAGSYINAMISSYNGYIYSGSTVYAATSMVVGGNTVLHAGNYGSYSLPLSGGTVTGTTAFTRTDDHAISVGTIRGRDVGGQGGNFIHMYERVHIGSPVGWGSRGAPSYGLSTYGGADLATDTGAVRITTGSLGVGDAGTRGLIFDGNYTSGQYRHRFRKEDPGAGLPLYIDYAHGTANAFTNIARFGGGGTYREFSVYGIQEIVRNIASPSNYYNGLQLEIQATSGTAGISLHRAGYSHIGIYHDELNTLKFNLNSGTVTLPYNAGTLIGTGNYTSYTVPVSGGTFTGNVKINPQGESWGEGLSFMMPSTSTWGGLRWQRQRSGYDGNWAVGYTALDSSDDLVFVANNGGSQVNDILRLTKAGNVSTSGSFTASGNVTAYSDERVKANWRTLDDGFVVNLSNVKSGIYDRTDIEITQVGVSAQSLRDVLPHAVIEANDGDLSVAYGNAAMVSAVELAKELVALKNEVAELRARIH